MRLPSAASLNPHLMCITQEMHHVHSCLYFLQPVSLLFPPTYVKIDGTGPPPPTWFPDSLFTHYKLNCSSGPKPHYPHTPARTLTAFPIGSSYFFFSSIIHYCLYLKLSSCICLRSHFSNTVWSTNREKGESVCISVIGASFCSLLKCPIREISNLR